MRMNISRWVWNTFGQPTYDLEPLLWQNNHRGVGNVWKDAWKVDLAASVQSLYEKKLLELVDMCPKENIILMGGCAAKLCCKQ